MFGSIVDLMAKLTLQKPGCHNWFEMGYSDLNYSNVQNHPVYINLLILSKALGFNVSMTSCSNLQTL